MDQIAPSRTMPGYLKPGPTNPDAWYRGHWPGFAPSHLKDYSVRILQRRTGHKTSTPVWKQFDEIAARSAKEAANRVMALIDPFEVFRVEVEGVDVEFKRRIHNSYPKG